MELTIFTTQKYVIELIPSNSILWKPKSPNAQMPLPNPPPLGRGLSPSKSPLRGDFYKQGVISGVRQLVTRCDKTLINLSFRKIPHPH